MAGSSGSASATPLPALIDSARPLAAIARRAANLVIIFSNTFQPTRSAPVFPRVSALLGHEFRRMAAIQIKTLAGVPCRQPGQFGRVAERKPQVLPGVPSGQRDTPRHRRGGCPLMVGDVPLRQASVLLAVPCVQ